MEAIIKASVKYGVKKIVVCSSFASIAGDLWKGRADTVYSEEDFAPYERTKDPYAKSKIA